MKIRKYKGIVIRRVNCGETDRIITLFTDKNGRMKLMGKGLRKVNSRRSPSLEMFSYVDLIVHEGRSPLPYLTEVALIDGFFGIRNNFRKIAIAYHVSEIIDKLTPEREKNDELYQSTLSFFSLLDREHSKVVLRRTVRVFIKNILINLGYLSEEKELSYSKLVNQVEDIIEKPLKSFHLLTKIAKEIE